MGFAELLVPGLAITRPTPEYLPAMKCLAARLPAPFRTGDTADIKFLPSKLRLRTLKSVEAIIADCFGGERLENAKRRLVEQLIAEANDETKAGARLAAAARARGGVCPRRDAGRYRDNLAVALAPVDPAFEPQAPATVVCAAGRVGAPGSSVIRRGFSGKESVRRG